MNQAEVFIQKYLEVIKLNWEVFHNLEIKIKKMMTFYNKVIPKNGWEKYSEINLEYQNQIICLKND